ncbi:MAG: amidohydrolase family protein, partial [Gammaproteobacteria bacterium]
MTSRISRRDFLEHGSAVLGAAVLPDPLKAAPADIRVPNSSGTARPRLRAPANACDCHMHIYDPARFPMPPSQRVAPANATVAEYRLLQQRIGTTRVVVVQPRNYAVDNRVTVDAIAQLAPNARGVAVLHPTVTDAQLKALNDAGFRGIRFSLGDPATAVVTPD